MKILTLGHLYETVSRDYNPARDTGGNTLLTILNFCPLVSDRLFVLPSILAY
jgi:hypothetical protein